MALTATERELAATVGFDEAVCEMVKQRTGRTFSRPLGYTEQFERVIVDGLSVAVRQDEIEPTLNALQPELRARGYRAFWSEIHSANGGKESDEIVVLKTDDPFAIVLLRCSNGCNYDVSTSDVRQKLQHWAMRCQLEVSGAAESWVAIRFHTLPTDVCTFAEEIYDFCPDTVEQGVGLMQERDDPDTFNAARQLCPTLSLKMQEKLVAQQARFEKIPIPKELRDQLNLSSTPTDMGIRLLAFELSRSKQIFLWWD